ncbi:tetratricopeptide repeat protein [Actinoplanes sp. NPDC049265]|uniref:tetratricopeptide repeat protein n=1 Tax=Actinoplanes sp. NPDC049265 TaxID=3363902 RepID=UPI0037124400
MSIEVFQRATALISAGRPEQALAELTRLPASDAISARAHYLRCVALANLERWPEAAESARQGLTAGGPDADLLRLLGRAEQEMGNLPVAERALLDGLALAPSDPDLLCAYARLCIADNQIDKAAKLVDRAAAQDPHSPTVYATRVQLAYARGDDRAAQRIAREFVAAYPENPAAHALLGGTSAARGHVGDAYSGLRQAAASAPDEQAYAESALEARIASHPLLVPIRPIMRFGPLKTWIAAIVIIYGLRAIGLGALSAVFAGLWLILCVYSWVVPPLVSRWMKRHWR